MSQQSPQQLYDIPNLVVWTAANTSSTPGVTANQHNLVSRGAIFYLNIANGVGATANASLVISNVDPGSGKLVPLLTTAPVAANAAGLFVYRIYPNLTPAANVDINGFLSRTWVANVVITATGANVSTGSLSVTLIP